MSVRRRICARKTEITTKLPELIVSTDTCPDGGNKAELGVRGGSASEGKLTTSLFPVVVRAVAREVRNTK